MSFFHRGQDAQPKYRALSTDKFGIGIHDYVLVRGETVDIADPEAVAILLANGHIEAIDGGT